MARQSKRRRGQRPRSKSPTKWHGAVSAPASLTTSAANTNFILLTAAQANEFVSPVVVRIVGDLYVIFQSVTATNERTLITAIRVQTEAGQLNPLVNIDANWMWYMTHFVRREVSITDVVVPVTHTHFDIPVSRKVPIDATLRCIFELTNEGAGVVRFVIAARVLVREA